MTFEKIKKYTNSIDPSELCNPDIHIYLSEVIIFENVLFNENSVYPCPSNSFLLVENSNYYFNNITVKNNINIFYEEGIPYSFIMFYGSHYKKDKLGNVIMNSLIMNN